MPSPVILGSPRASSAFVLIAHGLTRLYGDTVAVWRADLRTSSGEAVAIQGPNGSGKSTLLRLLAGLATPTSGTVSWAASAGASRPKVGYLGHASHLFEALTPVENIRLAARLARTDPDRGLRLLEELGIASWAGRRCGDLSAGTVRRVALARVLATDPDVVIVDEPFAALDPTAAGLVEATIRARCGQRLLILASHGDARTRAVADRLFEMCDGRLEERDTWSGALPAQTGSAG